MTVDQVITKAYQEAKGKPVPPAQGTTKYNSLLILCDNLQKIWAAEPDVEWNSLYSVVNIGPITATGSFAIPATVDYLIKRSTDPIYTSNGVSGHRKDYKLVQPNQLYLNKYTDGIAQAGSNLIFPQAFTSANTDFGWDLYAPAILKVDDITAGTDTVQVDDPMWLVFMVAADFVRNDLVRQNQYDRLVAYAQEVMRKMKQRNQGSDEEVILEWTPAGQDWE